MAKWMNGNYNGNFPEGKQNCYGKPQSEKAKEDKAFDLFADMLIKKIEESQKSNWKKPWFTEGKSISPKSLYGKPYHGMNALMLLLLCEEKGYKIPVFATHNRIDSLNYQIDDNGNKVPAVDGNGDKLPFLHIKKGEHSFPVFLSKVTIEHNETKEKLSWADYVSLKPEEQEDYKVYYTRRVYPVFNLEQTNLKEARPDLYEKFMSEGKSPVVESVGEEFSLEPLDLMVSEQAWVCPIDIRYQDDAYYSISKDKIVLPEKRQFTITGHTESFYSTMLHEMIHSTGAKDRLDRLSNQGVGAYAREELVAELGAALCCHRFGMDKVIKEDSIPYVKNWLSDLHENADYIKTVLKDVKLATSYVDVRLDKVLKLKEEEKVDERLDIVKQEESEVAFDETGDAYLVSGEGLYADKKNGGIDVKTGDEKVGGSQIEFHRGGFHR